MQKSVLKNKMSGKEDEKKISILLRWYMAASNPMAPNNNAIYAHANHWIPFFVVSCSTRNCTYRSRRRVKTKFCSRAY